MSKEQSTLKRSFTRIGVALLVAAAPVGVYLSPSHSSYPEVWDSRVLGVAHFVEEARGLHFKHPVEVAFLDEEAFKEKVSVAEATDEERKDEKLLVEELRAIGLLTGTPDLREAADELLESGVVGLYDSKEEALFVRGTELTPYVRAVLAHELTHALQDQYFDIDALQDEAPGGDDTAVRALIEGDALRVEVAYQNGLTDADKAAYVSEAQTAAGRSEDADVPEILRSIQEFPYLFGPTLIDVLVADGGNSSVDSAFRTPPTVDAQVIDPRAYPTTWEPKKVKAPHLPDQAKSAEDPSPFGQLPLLQVLGETVGYDQAWAAVQGWGGDTWQGYQLGGKTCVAVDVAMTEQAGATLLLAALRRWLPTSPGATATADGLLVSLRACDPGAAHSVRNVEPAPFDVLSNRSQLLHFLMAEQGLGFAAARCSVDGVIESIGAQSFTATSKGTATNEQQQQAGVAFRAALQECAT